MEAALPRIRFKAKFDALNFLAPVAPYLTKRQFNHAHGALGFPIHDPTAQEIRELSAQPLRYVEVAVDASPRRCVAPEERLPVLKEAFDTIASGLYPWNGPFMIANVRTNDGDTTKGATNRLPRFNAGEGCAETVYYGNKWDFAHMKLYLKTLDQGEELPVDEWVVRLELILRTGALPHLGLNLVGNLHTANLRTLLGKYFHCGRPILNGIDTRSKQYRNRHRLPPGLDRVIQDARSKYGNAEIKAQALRGGMQSLHDFANAKLNARSGYEALNRRIREPLSRIQ